MIISHEYKFIFIKTRKTAGSSVEKYLLDYLVGTDYVFAGMPPENLPAHNIKKPGDHEHKGWHWIQKNYPDEWDSYFTFAIDRNPWDRFVSAYYWFKRHNSRKAKRGFDAFIRDPKRYKNYVDWPMYANEDKVVVNRLVKYEDLHKEFLNLPIPYNNELLTTFLKQDNTRPADYRQMYNSETKELVREGSANVIKELGYEF